LLAGPLTSVLIYEPQRRKPKAGELVERVTPVNWDLARKVENLKNGLTSICPKGEQYCRSRFFVKVFVDGLFHYLSVKQRKQGQEMSNSPKPKEQHQNPRDPSRRRFLKGVSIAGATAAVADTLWIDAEAAEGQASSNRPLAGTIPVALEVNGKKQTVQVEPRTTLLNALRNHLDPPVTGAKLVCDMGTCGACTVLLDGKPVYSCLVLAVDSIRKKITTVEGLGSPQSPNAVQSAFVEKDGLMCGFCTPGFVTTISAYLKKNANPTLEEIREACKGNFCRCGTYPRVFEAALAAAKSVTSDR
jgi:xanthine dehydrogenase YagT iron-sulfur-binding subunit